MKDGWEVVVVVLLREESRMMGYMGIMRIMGYVVGF